MRREWFCSVRKPKGSAALVFGKAVAAIRALQCPVEHALGFATALVGAAAGWHVL